MSAELILNTYINKIKNNTYEQIENLKPMKKMSYKIKIIDYESTTEHDVIDLFNLRFIDKLYSKFDELQEYEYDDNGFIINNFYFETNEYRISYSYNTGNINYIEIIVRCKNNCYLNDYLLFTKILCEIENLQ